MSESKLINSQTRVTYLVLFCFGVVTSLMAIYAFHTKHIAFDYQGDSSKYIQPALGLFHYGKFGQFHNGIFFPELERLPLYPLFIYLSYALFGIYNNLAIVLMQALCMGGLVVAVAKSVALIEPQFVWVAGILTSICPNLFVRSAVILPDLVFAIFIAWGIYFLIASLKNRFLQNYILAFILFGFSLLTKPAFVLYPIFTLPFLVYLLYSKKCFNLVKSSGLALLSLAILIFIVAPQLVREKHYAKGYMLSIQTGVQSLYWIYPCLETEWGGKRDIAAMHRANELFLKKLKSIPANHSLSPAEVVHIQSHLAVSLIASISFVQLIKASLGSSLKLLFYTSFLGTAEAFHHHIPHVSTQLSHYRKTISELTANPWQLVILMSQLMVFLLRGLQILGVVYGIVQKEYRAMTLYLISGALSFIAVSIGLGNPRYRAPIEPELIIFSVLGIIAIYKYLKSRSSERRNAMLTAA